jgi:hypothetical protein
MNFLIMLILKYVFFTVMLFLTGMLMNCLFDGKEDLLGAIVEKKNRNEST